MMRLVLDYLSSSYVGGILALLLGAWLIWYSAQEDLDEVDWSSPFQGYISGWIAGIGFVVLGIIIILSRIFAWW